MRVNFQSGFLRGCSEQPVFCIDTEHSEASRLSSEDPGLSKNDSPESGLSHPFNTFITHWLTLRTPWKVVFGRYSLCAFGDGFYTVLPLTNILATACILLSCWLLLCVTLT